VLENGNLTSSDTGESVRVGDVSGGGGADDTGVVRGAIAHAA